MAGPPHSIGPGVTANMRIIPENQPSMRIDLTGTKHILEISATVWYVVVTPTSIPSRQLRPLPFGPGYSNQATDSIQPDTHSAVCNSLKRTQILHIQLTHRQACLKKSHTISELVQQKSKFRFKRLYCY